MISCQLRSEEHTQAKTISLIVLALRRSATNRGGKINVPYTFASFLLKFLNCELESYTENLGQQSFLIADVGQLVAQ